MAISPHGPQDIAALASALPDGTVGERMIVDAYSSDGWLMSGGYSVEGRLIASEGELLASELMAHAAPSLDLFPGVERGELRLNVRILYASMSASQAVDVSKSPLVFAVDALTDIEDAFAGRAAIIRADAAPDLRRAHSELVLGEPRG